MQAGTQALSDSQSAVITMIQSVAVCVPVKRQPRMDGTRSRAASFASVVVEFVGLKRYT